MKLWGMALIVLSGLLAGLLVASRLKRRVRLLLDLKALLQGFSTGIRFCSGSLSELIVEHQESPFCRQAEREPEFPEDPAAALEQAGRVLLWETGDLEWYQGMVRGLGVSDTQGQLEHLSLYQALLEPRLEQAREEARQKCRVQVALGLFPELCSACCCFKKWSGKGGVSSWKWI